ncbi:MAG TPA: hypothetical protein VJ873_04765 [bacterium]|nr:hypothetical protein [bacterium]
MAGVMSVVLSLPACDSVDRPVAPGSVSKTQPCVTLGNTAIESTNPGPPDMVFVPVVPSSSTTLYLLSVYTVASAASTFEAGVYSNNSGAPGNLLSETGPKTLSAPATQWNTALLKGYVALSGGVTYWLAFQATGYQYGPSGSGATFAYQAAASYGTLPGSFTGTVQSSPTYAFSIYGTASCP